MMSGANFAAAPKRVDRRDNWLALEQLRLALGNLKPNAVAMPLFAAIMCVMFSKWIPARLLVLWFSFVVIGGVPLGIMAFQFPRRSLEDLRRWPWVSVASLAYFLFTASWSSFGVMF